jgi:CTP synthase
MGFRITSIKIDPYLNVDAGTMSPFEHGEVFVLKDGGEGDLDLGNYERFLDVELTKDHNITTGKVYQSVISRERRGDYLGKTVQVVPHVTNAIQDWIERVAYRPVDGLHGQPNICLVEVGGTVGDIESMVFLEALRQFQFRVKRENVCFVHVSLVPALNSVGEQKTKPTQHGVKQLMMAGLQPDLLVCRSQNELQSGIREKLAMFCHVNVNNVLSVHDVSNIYHVPNMLQKQGLPSVICQSLCLTPPMTLPSPMLVKWNQMAEAVDTFSEKVVIAVVGKYTGLADAYLSVIKALKHSSIAAGRRLRIDWVEATDLEDTNKTNKTEYDNAWATMKAADGILVPGGFGSRGVEGKILAANYARTSKVPFLGVCLGMQCAVIEWARNMCDLKDANSAEFDETTANPVSYALVLFVVAAVVVVFDDGHFDQYICQCQRPHHNEYTPPPALTFVFLLLYFYFYQVVIFMPEINPDQMGGTMRLGERSTILKEYDGYPHTLASTLYGNVDAVNERHRHRYEVNPEFVPLLEEKGLMFTGVDDRNQRMEIIELKEQDHPFYLGCQYHPEFKTVVGKPSPPFYGFILASTGQFKGIGKPLPTTDRFHNLLGIPAAKSVSTKRGTPSSSSSSSSSSKRVRHS